MLQTYINFIFLSYILFQEYTKQKQNNKKTEYLLMEFIDNKTNILDFVNLKINVVFYYIECKVDDNSYNYIYNARLNKVYNLETQETEFFNVSYENGNDYFCELFIKELI